jgi:hydrogenase expression/formation protein HypC
MCLAIPAQIETIEGRRARVHLDGSRTDVLIDLVPEASTGDWVLVHAGMAITVLDETEARETYDLLKRGGEDTHVTS